MQHNKFIHIRIPRAFHEHLVEYAADHFISISSLVLSTLAKEIKYVPRKATPRTSMDVEPIAVEIEPEFGDLSTEDYRAAKDDSTDFAELQRRAAAAPLSPVG